MTTDDVIVQYYREQLDTWMAHQAGHSIFVQLLDALLADGFLIESVQCSVSCVYLKSASKAYPDNTYTQMIYGVCYNDAMTNYKFEARYVIHPRQDLPENPPYLLSEIVMEATND